jgi:hypothetical protein
MFAARRKAATSANVVDGASTTETTSDEQQMEACEQMVRGLLACDVAARCAFVATSMPSSFGKRVPYRVCRCADYSDGAMRASDDERRHDTAASWRRVVVVVACAQR